MYAQNNVTPPYTNETTTTQMSSDPPIVESMDYRYNVQYNKDLPSHKYTKQSSRSKINYELPPKVMTARKNSMTDRNIIDSRASEEE